jgi:predicted cupin superfamily sugar epimerase
MKAGDFVKALQLQAHPEGGYFAEHYRSPLRIELPDFVGSRSAATSIYFLLEAGQFSALHRIKSDEIWHFYAGGSLEIIEIDLNGNLLSTRLGNNLQGGEHFSYTVKAGHWFGSRPAPGSEFALVGCTVAPGFDFADFEMPDQAWFLKEFPEHASLIREMTRP